MGGAGIYIGSSKSKKYDHEITLDGNTICRDGKSVRIIGFTDTRDLQVGCTFITRAALLKLVELSTNCDIGSEKTLQWGSY